MKKYLKEVEEVILSITPVVKPEKWLAKNYVGAGRSNLKYLDIKIPLVRNAFKNGFSFYHPKSKSNDEKLCWQVFDYIWKESKYFEVMLLSSYFVSTKSIEEKIANSQILFSWQGKVDNWAHSDELSNHYSQMLEVEPKYYALFKKWNCSSNSWERRQSLVGLLFYSRFRNKPLAWTKIKPMIDNLIDDEDYYVQKGIGWALREAYNVYPKTALKYITQKSSELSSIAWVAATEKLEKKIKQAILNKRKKVKKSKQRMKV